MMSKDKIKKNVLVMTLLILIIGSVSSLCYTYAFKHYSYQSVAKIIGSLTNQKPEDETRLMSAMKNASEKDIRLGEETLRKYGYTYETILQNDSKDIIVISLLTIMGMMVLIGVYIVKLRKDYNLRIKELTRYLDTATKGNSFTLIEKKEDDFSILEDQIYKTISELYETRELAVAQKEALKDNLADISHQLKTPLTAMGLMSELLHENVKDEDGRVYIQQIQNQVTRLEYLVSSLLTLSKLDANMVQMESQEVEVYVLLLRVIELIEPLVSSQNQTIVIGNEFNNQGTSTEELAKAFFYGDLKWSIEAIYNLVKNCAEHTPQGKKIMVSYSQNPLFTEIVIEDEGEGFDKEDIPYLFRRFYKGKNAGKDSVGIGLALAKAVIEKQNGIIEAENREEGGVRFRIKLYSR